MAASGGVASSESAAHCQYGFHTHDCDPGGMEHQSYVLHHCDKIHWRSGNCKVERREIRHCEKTRSKDRCLKYAGPMRR